MWSSSPNPLLLLFSRWVMSDSFATPQTVPHQAPLSMGFSRQEYWSGLPFPSPEDPPNPRIKLVSPALVGRFLTSEPPEKPPKPHNPIQQWEKHQTNPNWIHSTKYLTSAQNCPGYEEKSEKLLQSRGDMITQCNAVSWMGSWDKKRTPSKT